MCRTHSLVACLFLALCLPQCKSNYPSCEQDTDCQEHHEVCLNGHCQECRDDAHCANLYPGQKRSCLDGRCELAAQCRIDSDCAAFGSHMACSAGTCVTPCDADADCAGGQCKNHHCVNKSCSLDGDCAPGQNCIAHQCQNDSTTEKAASSCRPSRAGDVVNLEMIFFEFNKYELTEAAREQLAGVAQCLQMAPASLRVIVEGHCDDRGTQEYNLALGEKRAYAVYNYFKQLGLTSGRQLTVRSKGENEPLCQEATEACYSRNRRVQFLQNARAAR